MYHIYSVKKKNHQHEGIWNENRHVKMLTKKSPYNSHPPTTPQKYSSKHVGFAIRLQQGGQRSKINGGAQHAELLKNNVTFFHSQHKKWATCSGQIIV